MEAQTLAALVAAPRHPVQVMPVPIREPGTGEVLVRMEACGLCHSDIFLSSLEKLPMAPLILGHEGIGRVERVGTGVDGFARGDRVGITFLAATCGLCEFCFTDRERFCLKQRNFGFTAPGVLTEYATVPIPQLFRVPDTLPAAEVAPLCCAGWTAYGALRESGLRESQTVALFGMGGLGHLAIQYAAKLGFRVAAIARGEGKRELALQLGASEYIDSSAVDPAKALQELGGAQVIVATAASGASMSPLIDGLGLRGRLIVVGAATDPIEVTTGSLIFGGRSIHGSLTGTPSENEENLAFSLANDVRPLVEVVPLEEAGTAYGRMMSGAARFRMVLTTTQEG